MKRHRVELHDSTNHTVVTKAATSPRFDRRLHDRVRSIPSD